MSAKKARSISVPFDPLDVSDLYEKTYGGIAVGERIVIGGRVAFQVDYVSEKGARLAIDAPDNLRIDRASFYREKNTENPERDVVEVGDLKEAFHPASLKCLTLMVRRDESIHLGHDTVIVVNDTFPEDDRATVSVYTKPDIKPQSWKRFSRESGMDQALRAQPPKP